MDWDKLWSRDDLTVAHLVNRNEGVKYNHAVSSVADIATARKDALISFIALNDAELPARLRLLAANVVEVRRHAFAIAAPCVPEGFAWSVSPYALCTKHRLMEIALKCGLPVMGANLDKPFLASLLCSKVREVPVMSVEGERLRFQKMTTYIRELHDAFHDARFLEELKKASFWLVADTFAHRNCDILLKRLKDLQFEHKHGTLPDRVKKLFAAVAFRLRHHVLPFLQFRTDLIPWKYATLDGIGLSDWLSALNLPAICYLKEFQKEDTDFFPIESQFFVRNELLNSGSYQLRTPQRDALKALQDIPGPVEERKLLTWNSLMMEYMWLSSTRVKYASFILGLYRWQVYDHEPELEQYRVTFRKKPALLTPLMIVLPTGLGKSATMCLAPFHRPQRPKRVLVIVPNVAIREQLLALFRTFFEKSGFVSGNPEVCSDPTSETACVHVLNIQALQGDKLFELYPRDHFDLIMIDEAHHAEAHTYRLMREHFIASEFLYFTATPFRSDGKVLEAKEIFSCPLSEGIYRRYVKNVCFAEVPVSRILIEGFQGSTVELSREQLVDRASEFCRLVKRSVSCKMLVMGHAMKILRDLRNHGVKHQGVFLSKCLRDCSPLMVSFYSHCSSV
jgi:hypothetical protein